jgi:lipopolysaccharide transport system permease protein/teichoic acid transport system permease protein
VFNLFKGFIYFLIDIVKSRRLIFELTKQDFKSRYLGSYLGIIWAYIQPTITILIFWFVFQVGFKSTPIDDFPFILWLMSGMIPWFFFSEGLQNASNSIVENSFLVKKVVFRVSILPVIKVLSSLFVHLFFIGFLFVMFFIYGYQPDIYNLQVFYYLVANIVLVLALSWLTSSLAVFLKDVGQIVAMLLQFGFWLTPIFWSYNMIPGKYQSLIKLNPVYYIVEGFRNSFIYKKWFWESLDQTLYFWFFALSVFIIGAVVFKRLRPYFADVL